MASESKDAIRARDVQRIVGALPRALAHTLKDAIERAWNAGYDMQDASEMEALAAQPGTGEGA